jgi:hypothetical protein
MDLAPSALPGSWQTPNVHWLNALPRDEAALRDRLYADAAGHGRSTDGEVVVLVADVLRSGLVPADLRRALFRVLRTVPGVDVTSTVLTLDGRQGVGIGRTERVDGFRQELVFDAATREFIGEREVDLDGISGVPPGSARGETAVIRGVVDRVPAEVLAVAVSESCVVRADGAIACTEPSQSPPAGPAHGR